MMPKIKMLKEDNVRRGFFERAEFEKVRENLPEPLRPLVTLAYCAGWRKSELFGLQWRQVDLDARNESPSTRPKNGEGRSFVFDGLTEVQTMLEAQRKLPFVTPFVFHRKGEARSRASEGRGRRRAFFFFFFFFFFFKKIKDRRRCPAG